MARSRLRIEITEPAEAQIDEAYRWLLLVADYQAAEKWITAFTKAVENEAQMQATLPILRPAPSASDLIPGVDLRQLQVRSPGGSPWHVLYEFTDDDGDGETDTLKVHRVRHATRNTARNTACNTACNTARNN